MAGLLLADVLDILDSIAKQAQNAVEAGFGANTTGYTANRASIIGASSDSDFAAVADLSVAFKDDIVVIPAIGSWWENRRRALEIHLQSAGGMSAYLIANDKRVHPFLRDYLNWVLGPSAFFRYPAHNHANGDPMGRFVFSGAGAGSFTNGAAVDLTKFGKAWLEVEVAGQTLSDDADITIIGTKIDSTSQSKVVHLTSGSIVGTKAAVGTLGLTGDHYVDVTNITVSGGGASDEVYVNTVVERAISLT